jgi:hypothetical protein
MTIDGIYDITIKTPMGDQKVVLTLKTDGNLLSGTSESPMTGKNEFTGGKVDGNKLEWTDIAKTPMGPLKMDITATIEGDTFKGISKTPFGPANMEGKRR